MFSTREYGYFPTSLPAVVSIENSDYCKDIESNNLEGLPVATLCDFPTSLPSTPLGSDLFENPRAVIRATPDPPGDFAVIRARRVYRSIFAYLFLLSVFVMFILMCLYYGKVM